MHMTRNAAAVFALALAACSTAAARVAPAGLDAALRRAKDGATVRLIPGETYGATRALSGRVFPQCVTVDATGATISGAWYFGNTGCVVIRGGTWTGGLRFDRSTKVTVQDAAFVGAPNTGASALVLVGVTDAVIDKNIFTGFRMGIASNDSRGLKITNNVGDQLRSDFIQIGRGDDILIQGNTCKAATLVFGSDHPDCVQFFSSKTDYSSNITVADNVLSGMAQGVFMADGLYRDVKILRNRVDVGMVRGISIVDLAENVVAEDNVVSTPEGAQHQSRFLVPKTAQRCGNSVARFGGKAGNKDGRCGKVKAPE